jgi:hypothetical protein
MWAPNFRPDARPGSAIEGFAALGVWRAKCLNKAAMHQSLNCLQKVIPAELRGRRRFTRNKGVNMYATKAVNGVPAIQRDGQSVLSVWDQNWDFANWLCALLNELGHMPELLLTERDREWLKAIDGVFARNVQHA